MTIKTIALAAAATVALASTASANFSFTDAPVDSATAELGNVTAAGNGVISIYDNNLGVQGALLGTEEVRAGANYDVRVNLGKKPINDVVAVLSVNGQVVDTLELDVEN